MARIVTDNQTYVKGIQRKSIRWTLPEMPHPYAASSLIDTASKTDRIYVRPP
jgi:hypothetical protein